MQERLGPIRVRVKKFLIPMSFWISIIGFLESSKTNVFPRNKMVCENKILQ